MHYFLLYVVNETIDRGNEGQGLIFDRSIQTVICLSKFHECEGPGLSIIKAMIKM